MDQALALDVAAEPLYQNVPSVDAGECRAEDKDAGECRAEGALDVAEKDEFKCLHDLDEMIFLKSIFENFVFPRHSNDNSVDFDSTGLVETCYHVCSKHAVVLKDLILLHGMQCLDHPSVMNQLNLLVVCVQQIMWAKVLFFVESSRSFCLVDLRRSSR